MRVNGFISYMVSLAASWAAKTDKATMNFNVISLQPPRIWTNQVSEPEMGVLVDRGKGQWHTLKVYLSAGPRVAENV
jgi:hypothetical protein